MPDTLEQHAMQFNAREWPLSRLTSIGFGGPAEILAVPERVDDLAALLARARRWGCPVRCLGRGTNLLVDDAGLEGLVVAVGRSPMQEVRVEGTRVTASGGTPLRRLVAAALQHDLAGLEGLTGVPGSVGGAIRTNAGTAAGAIGDVTAAVTVIDANGQLRRLGRGDFAFGYRTSSFVDEVIVAAEFELALGDAAHLAERVRDLRLRRKHTQPTRCRSAGCIFKNPGGAPAGRLIDDAGLKGATVGGMTVSHRHANFLINAGGATFDDARRLIDLVRDRVRRVFGVDLELEVNVWTHRGPQAGTLTLL